MNFAKQLLNLGLAVAAAGLVSCSTPKPECTVGQSGFLGGLSGNDFLAFSTRYVVKENPMSCPEMKPELVGFQSYHPANSDGQTRDFSKTSIAIRTQNHGELFWMNEDFGLDNSEFTPNALGDFAAAEPDDADFCQVPTISDAHVIFPGADVPVDTGEPCMDDPGCEAVIPGSVCEIPTDATEGTCFVTVTLAQADLTYKWSNLQFYVTAGAPGTQFTGDVEISLNGCTATYTAVGMWPAVDCAIHDPDTFAVTGSDQQLCNPEPDALNGRPIGSGINPDFGPTKCDDSFALTDAVEGYYTNFIYGYPLSTPRCVLDTDEIPALGGFTAPEGQ